MNNRAKLQEELEQLLGSRRVYFQAPKNTQMEYPCIIYSRIKFQNQYADSRVYNQQDRYEIIVIDKKADSPIARKVSLFNTIYHDRHYVSEGLHHDVFTLYY